MGSLHKLQISRAPKNPIEAWFTNSCSIARINCSLDLNCRL